MYSVSVSSACYKEESMLKAVKVSHLCCNVTRSFFFFFKAPLGYEKSQFKHLNLFFFFFQWRKSLYSHNKNKSVLYFTIYFKYFHYEALISPTRSISIQHFQKTSVTGTHLGGTICTATLHHFFNLVHKRRPVGALEGVFPPLAP